VNLDLDDIAEINMHSLGIDTRTEAGRKELMQLAFVEDALSEEDAIESMYYLHGRPSKWDFFYDKWFSMDLTKTGGSPSHLMVLTWILTTPFIWIYRKVI
jgi:hypothetical protein